jgi:hypothetical protein
MVRNAWALLVGVVLLVPGAARAADAAPAGAWKVTLVVDDGRQVIWLLKIESKDGKWTGKIADTTKGFGASTLTDFSFKDDVLRFSVKMETRTGTMPIGFEGKVPKGEAQFIRGTLLNPQDVFLCELEPTAVKSLDPFELNKELLAKKPNDPMVFRAALTLLTNAAENKAKPEEVRSWAEKAMKAAEPFGTRWQREIAARVARILSDQEGFQAIALAYAQRADRMLEPRDDPKTKVRVLTVLTAVLKKAGKEKEKEAKEAQERLDKAEKDHKEYLAKLEKERQADAERAEEKADATYLEKMPGFKPEPFAGRKAKSERVVLVELFVNAEERACVAADLAFLGLLRTYKPADIVLLQYHVPGDYPDPMATADSIARDKFYGDDVTGTPTIFFNGKVEDVGGGTMDDAKKIYGLYRKALEPLLEKPATVKLTAGATRKGNKIDIVAEASGIEKPSDDLRLRIALTEERIRYVGSNTIRLHHNVVRAMPGGDKGLVLKGKSGKQTASVDIEELRKKLAKNLAKVPETEPLLAFKNLRVVAFVQNDKTKEVLQAVQVDVKMAKE